jgi:hypothetical protein
MLRNKSEYLDSIKETSHPQVHHHLFSYGVLSYSDAVSNTVDNVNGYLRKY